MRKLIATYRPVARASPRCGVVNTLVDSFKSLQAVRADLEKVTGNEAKLSTSAGTMAVLVSVKVNFPQLYEAKPLGELTEQVRVVVTEQFKQAPEQIMLSSACPTSCRTAQAASAAASANYSAFQQACPTTAGTVRQETRQMKIRAPLPIPWR